MTVWTLTYNWIEIEKDNSAMDSILLDVYATKNLAKKAMEKETDFVKDNPSFHMEDEFASVDMGDRHCMWEIEEWEVKDENTGN